MAITQGHGNPSWTWDEAVLALDLYFDCNGKIPGPNDPRVQRVSELLRAFPHHAEAARQESFRNPAGVAFKLQNLRQVATGKGLSNVSKIDREVWETLGNDPARTKNLAEQISAGVELLGQTPEADSEDEFAEGKIVTQTHIRRERNRSLRNKVIEKHKNGMGLYCDVCGTAGSDVDPELREAMFECHHIIPLEESAERKTRLSDLALLCASCHRLIHRAISYKKRWVSIDEAKKLIAPRQHDTST